MDDQVLEQAAQEQAVPAEAQAAPVSPVAPVAPNLTQEQLNKIISREKVRAADSARRELEMKYQRDIEELNKLRQMQQQRNSEVPRDVDADAMYQQVTERWNKEIQDRQLKEQMNQVANTYYEKVNKARDSYEDFDDVMKNFDESEFPNLSFLLAGIDNAGDVLYDLLKNGTKLANINTLAQTKSTIKLAQNELLKLSKSISDNQKAKQESQQQNANAPLGRLQPSPVAGDNGKMGIQDLRNQPWLRG